MIPKSWDRPLDLQLSTNRQSLLVNKDTNEIKEIEHMEPTRTNNWLRLTKDLWLFQAVVFNSSTWYRIYSPSSYQEDDELYVFLADVVLVKPKLFLPFKDCSPLPEEDTNKVLEADFPEMLGVCELVKRHIYKEIPRGSHELN